MPVEREALRLGGTEGVRYATVQREIAKAQAEGVDITADLIASVS